MSFSASKAATALAGVQAQNTTVVNIREAYQIDDRFARIVAQASCDASAEQVFNGIREQAAHITPIPGSFVSLAKDGRNHVFEGIVGIVAERRVVNDEKLAANYKAVAANMFMDDDEVLWSLKATASGKVLVKSAVSDDLAIMQNLMACASADVNDFQYRNIGGESSQVRAMVQGGDLIQYVSHLSATAEMGIAAVSYNNEDGSDTFKIEVVRPNGQSETIDRNMIVAVAEHEIEDAEEDNELAVASATIDMAKISAYYAKVFARRPAYYEQFMQRFRSHVFF